MPNPKLQAIGKLLGVGEDYVEKMLARAPKQVPGQDMTVGFRPPKVSDLGTESMSADDLKTLYNKFLGQGASPSDARMQQINSIIGQRERNTARNVQQLADRQAQPIQDLATKKANMMTPATGESEEAPTPMSLTDKLKQADKMGMQLGAGVVGADASDEGESVNDIAKAKAASLRKMLGME